MKAEVNLRAKAWVLVALFLLAACSAGAPVRDQRPIAVAVWDLEDLSVHPIDRIGMGELMAQQIAAHLEGRADYQVVERQRLLDVMEELHIGSSDLADASTRLQLGRIIGARQMVFGAYQAIGASLRLDVRRVDVGTGRVLNTATADAPVDNPSAWLSAAEQAAEALFP
ncbi:CsgG/HfaB family protein [Desulfatitalea alkaliphila]|uniref:CsgG/HfaB family protein n=1 Tax=Desulfatitalea alkaliphila TaxID=2929485 RepID=A0AA41R4J7_9BACT|nr:CsgG/HfaB family protein [Desulfatitalea alkaliphila]MCJ8501802.1 CsgG/HfaB family protein [Desulfatitalea alkaliphila]